MISISDQPWISEAATHWLGKFLKAKMKVFEYGSGGSTLYLAKRVQQVVSVENNWSWFLAVKKALRENKLKNVAVHYAGHEKLTPETSAFVSSDPSDPKYFNISFKNYVTTINKYPDKYFDLVFVDGRARNSCLVMGIPKVKKGGYIFLDDSQRPGYNPGILSLKNYQKKKFIGTGQYIGKESTIWKIKD